MVKSRRPFCSVMEFQRMISGKYKLRILWDLREGPRRYGVIRSGLLRGTPGTAEISRRVLSRELKVLTEMGLVRREDFRVVPPRVEYSLTPMGKSFVPIIGEMHAWSRRHLKPPAQSREISSPDAGSESRATGTRGRSERLPASGSSA